MSDENTISSPSAKSFADSFPDPSPGEDMVIPDEVIEAADSAVEDTARGLNTVPAYQVIARWARDEALSEAADAVTNLAPYNCELNPDGSEDRITAAWVEGIHDAWSTIVALAGKDENQ